MTGAGADAFRVVVVGGGLRPSRRTCSSRPRRRAHRSYAGCPGAGFRVPPDDGPRAVRLRCRAALPLAAIVDDLGATLVVDRFGWVDAPARVAHTETGRAVPYDALVLASGAHAHARYEHALTLDDRRLDDQLHGLIQDIEGGYVHSLAFVMPAHKAWPLPLYELALMTAQRAHDSSATSKSR